MKKDHGNIIILFVLILLIIIIFFIFTLKTKIERAWTPSSSSKSNSFAHPLPLNSNSDKELALNKELSTSPLPPRKEEQRYEYYNDLSSISNGEIINPFLKQFNVQTMHSEQDNGILSPITNDLKSKSQNRNLIQKAPNGFDFPNKTGLLMGYPTLHQIGKLNITISNKLGHSNLAVFLYQKKPFNDQRSIDLNILLTGIYLKAGDDFTFSKLQSGYYRIIWINLANKKSYRSKDFPLYQDNQYAYDRIFTFYPNNTSLKNKATEITTESLYRSNN